jgi:O-antigen/teichoic acid export membrane protein
MSAGEPKVTFEPEAAVAPSIGDSASAGARRIVLARLGSLALVFVGAIILSRTLGPENRGAHAFYVALVILFAAILGLSAPTGGYVLSTRHDAPQRQLAVNSLWLAALAGLVATAIAIVLQAVFAFLPAPLAAVPTWPLLIGVGVAGFAANTHQLQLAFARGRSMAGAALSFGPTTLAAFGYLALPLTGAGLPAALWIFGLAPWVVALAAALVRPPLSIAAFGRVRVRLAGRAIREGLRNYPGEIAGLLHQRADVLLLGVLSTATSLGIYVVAYQSVEPILILSSAGGATILGLGHGRPEVERGAVTARLIREALLVGGALALLAALLSPVLVPIVYGAEFSDAVLPLAILAPGIVALACGRIAMADLLRRNMLERMAAISVSVAILNVGLNLVLIPPFGAVGAATASLTSYSALAVLAIAFDRRASGFAARALVPRRADVVDLVRAWSRPTG